MKTDPNKHCINFEQHLGWAILHDVLAHPLMGLTLYCKWSRDFHNFTSHKAWKRKKDDHIVIQNVTQTGNNNSFTVFNGVKLYDDDDIQ